MFSVPWWHRHLYPNPDALDTMSAFRRLLYAHVTPAMRVLDIGAGAGALNPYDLRGRCDEIVGVDSDPRVMSNPLLDCGVQAAPGTLPFEDESFDVAFSIYVLEHVEDPAAFVAEAWRVLKPGGYFLSIAPNRCHYVAWLGRLTPEWFHGWFRRKHYKADEEDTFETYYRLNTRRDLQRHFAAGGFHTVSMATMEATPNYLTFSVPSFLLGALYERFVSRTESLADFRANILCAFGKGPSGSEGQ